MNRLGFRVGYQSLIFGRAVVFFLGAAGRADDAAALYKTKCVACHAADGSGTTVGKKLGAMICATLTCKKRVTRTSHGIVAKGKNKMPAYEKTRPIRCREQISF